MVGMLVWKKHEAGKREKSVVLRERNVLHVRVLCAEIQRGKHTPDPVVRQRLRKAVKRLQKLGIRQVILPPDFPWRELLAERGIRPVSALPLRQMLAADWVRWELRGRGIPAAGARVAVLAGEMTGAVVRTVTELSLRHRYVLLKVPYGGESLCSQLRREYGVSLLLNPDKGQLRSADIAVIFDPQTETDLKGSIPIYDDSAVIPPLLLPPALEDLMPPDAERTQMLAVLMEAGAVRPGQIVFQGGDS